MEALMKRTFDGLVPADEEALECMQRLKLGKIVKCNITQARNLGFHRKFMAMVRLVFDNQDEYDNFNVFLNIVVKTITGHVDTVVKEHNGKTFVAYVPRSISFANMEQLEFEQFYATTLQALINRYMHGTDADDVTHEVDQLVGFV